MERSFTATQPLHSPEDEDDVEPLIRLRKNAKPQHQRRNPTQADSSPTGIYIDTAQFEGYKKFINFQNGQQNQLQIQQSRPLLPAISPAPLTEVGSEEMSTFNLMEARQLGVKYLIPLFFFHGSSILVASD